MKIASHRTYNPLLSVAQRNRTSPGFASKSIGAVLTAALLVGSAAFLSIEIATRAHPLLAWFTLFPLLAVIRICNSRIAALGGAIWGAGLFYFLAMSGNPIVPATIASAVFLIGVPAAYAFGMGCVTRRFGFNPLILSFGWCAVELAVLPLGLRGGLLGGIAGDSGSFLSLLQGLLGYVCMAALIVAVNAIALSVLSHAYARVCAAGRFVRGTAAELRSRSVLQEFAVACRFFGHVVQPRAPPTLA